MKLKTVALSVPIAMAVLGALDPGVNAESRLGPIGVKGTYAYTGGQSERTTREQSIEFVVGRMNALLRPFARITLREITSIPWRLEIRYQGEQLGIALTPLPMRTSTLDGRVTRFTTTAGRSATMRRVVRGNALVETVTTSGGKRVITYRPVNGGNTLRLRWSISSRKHLPAPVTYSITYRQES